MPNSRVPNKTDETQTEAVEQTPVHVDHLIAYGELAAENAWCVSYDVETLPEQRPAFVPLALWQANQEDAELAPLLTSDTELTAELAQQLGSAQAIAIAVGDVLVDQLDYMRRCGFLSMALRDDQHPEDALRALSFISVRYQSDVEERQALFERRLTASE